jgi:hypothetical protein
MIKAAAKTLVESIQRWIAWFRKTSEASSASPGAVAEEMGARAKVNSETLQETQQSLSELSAATASGQVQSTGADKPRVLPNFDALLAQLLQNSPRYARYEGFFGHATSVHHDIVEGGPYTQAFRAITPTLSGARTLLEQRASVLAQLANAAAQGQSDIQKIVSTRAAMEVAKPLEIRYAGRTCTLHEAADHLARVRQEVQALTPTKRLDLDYVSLAVSDAYAKHDVAAFFYEQGQILVLLAELSTSLTQMQKGMSLSESIKDATSETLGNVLREAVFSLSKDVNGYQQLFAELRQYGQSLERLTQETLNMAQEVDHQLLTHVAKGHLKAPAAWVERAKKMRLRRVQTLFGNA